MRFVRHIAALISLGVAGEFQHPKMVDAMEKIKESCLRNGVAPGTQTRNLALAKFWRDRGMLFLFLKSDDYPFWMKNTLIPLDMVWIDEQRRIAHVSSNVPPCKADPCPNYDPKAVAKYVLELAAGVAAKHHLANGQSVRFEGMDNVVVR